MNRLVQRRNRKLAVLLATASAISLLSFAPGPAAASGGTALSLGYNYSGQAGVGAGYTEPGPKGCYCVFVPTPLLGVKNATSIVAGYEFGLALRSDGSVMSWGYNYEGELGDGTTTVDPVPKPVPGITTAIAVAAGSSHAMALLADGTVLTWGSNDDGELGLGSPIGPEECSGGLPCAKLPKPVPGLSGVVAIAAGNYASYALLADGTVVGWGQAANGEIGNGASVENECKCASTPTPIPGVAGAVAIAGGDGTGTAVLRDGTVRAWGSNEYGELGIGSASAGGCLCLGVVTPAGVTGVRQISSGGGQSVAIAAGQAVSWGLNDDGQLGLGSESANTCTCMATPGAVGSLAGARKVDAGDSHSLALLADGTLRAWGSNSYAQLGAGEVGTNSPTPAAVAGVSGASDVTASDYNSYAIVGPSQTLSIAFAGAGSGAVGGSGILCSAACSQPFAQGEVRALRAEPASPGQFAGFTGAGCSGTGPCFARLDSDQIVTATFGEPTGTTITKLKLSGKKKKTAKLAFTAPGAVTGFECMFVRPVKKKAVAKKSAKKKKPRFIGCKSGKAYKKLKPGKYTFKVRALNILGADAKPAKKSFRVKAPKKKKKKT
jgi:hypothetical protein